MGVIVDAANLKSDHLMFTSTTANTCPNIIFDLGPDEVESIFGAKDDVKVDLREGVGHAVLSLGLEVKSPVPGV